MQINLYGENDTRPVGKYEWCSSAFVTPFNILFVSQIGVQILSTLRFKLTLDPDDQVAFNKLNSNYEITGSVKPKETKDSTDDFDTRKPTKPSGRKPAAGPRSSASHRAPAEINSNDSDEKFIPRAKRKAAAQGDRGQTGQLFPDDTTGID